MLNASLDGERKIRLQVFTVNRMVTRQQYYVNRVTFVRDQMMQHFLYLLFFVDTCSFHLIFDEFMFVWLDFKVLIHWLVK